MLNERKVTIEDVKYMCLPYLHFSMIYFLVLTTAFLVFRIYGLKFFRKVQLAANIPGPNIMIMIKTMLFTMKAHPLEMYSLFLLLKDNFPDLAKLWLGPKLLVFLYNPADIELILSSSVHIDKSSEYSVFQPWFGNGLLISTGAKWKQHRKMIAPTFHQSILKNFVPKFYENSLKVCEKMKRERGKTFDCHKYMSGTTVDILLETAMGYHIPRSEEAGSQYAMAVMKLCNILHRRHYKIWLYSEHIFQTTKLAVEQSKLLMVVRGLSVKVIENKKKEVIKMAEQVVESSIEVKMKAKTTVTERISGYNYGTAVRDDLDDVDEIDVGEKKRLAFLEQLTVNAQREDVDFTEEEVLDQVNTIMFEGHDTTAAASSFALCLLGIHQDIQDKVIQEIDEIFQNSSRVCTFADTLEMKYLERVIMETLRMYPPVPAMSRELKEEIKLASGDYCLPIGATITIAPAILHRRSDSFPNPDVFNPDHFLPENCQKRHYYSYIPFSAGPRSCVGRKFAILKLKVLLSTIFRTYRVHCNMVEQQFQLQGDIILKIAGGFNISLEARTEMLQ